MAAQLIAGAIGAFAQGALTAQQVRENNALIEKNKQIALENFNNNQTAIATQFDNYKTQAALDVFQSEIDKNKAIGSSKVAAAGAGFSGTTTETIINNIKLQDQFKTNIRDRNVQTVALNSKNAAASQFLDLQAQLNNLDAQKGSLTDILIGTVSGGIKGASSAATIQQGITEFNDLVADFKK